MLLNVSGVRKAFGTDVVLDGVSFRLERREKVALVGRNGTGKTTLLKILTGQEEPDGGSVYIARGAKLGYLRQEDPVDAGRTVLEEAEEARKHALELKARLEELEARLEHSPTDEDLEEYATLHEHFIEAEGYKAEQDLRTVLMKMGFHEDELDKPTGKLSGGETTRLALARLILEEPDLLILDEPTNHLDLQATEWLEGWLRSYPGAVLLVSHDRTFLENVGDRVLEMADGTIKSYPGPFPKYLKLRAEEEIRQAEVAKRQQEQIDKLDEFVRRFMNSQRTAQARGKLKIMNRLIASKTEAPKAAKGMAASVKAAKRSGDVVVACEKLTIGFPDVSADVAQASRLGNPASQPESPPSSTLPATGLGNVATQAGRLGYTGCSYVPLIKGLDWTVRIGERWGVIGENGSGKSTLIKTILGLREAQEGSARLGANVQAGYFAQDDSELNPEQSPLEYMVYEVGLLPAEARDLLGRYLITGEDVFRPIKTFSGGEKNKLSLAHLTAQNPNLLVLDEPTNHLDMASREALAQVLAGYNGTLILISHDRWLLSKVTNHTLDIRREDVKQFGGSYEEYRRWTEVRGPGSGRESRSEARGPRSVEKRLQTGPSRAQSPNPRPQTPDPSSPPSEAVNRHSSIANPAVSFRPRELSKEIQRLEKVVVGCEERITRLELEVKAVEARLAAPMADTNLFELTLTHQDLQAQLAGAMESWEEASTSLESLRRMQG